MYAKKTHTAVSTGPYCGTIGVDIRTMRATEDGTEVRGKGVRFGLDELSTIIGELIEIERAALAAVTVKAPRKARKAA